jgi:hypothetical protein
MSNITSIRKGSLYYNGISRQVERVLGVLNSQRVWTKRHQSPAADVQIKNLRRANKRQVAKYFEE